MVRFIVALCILASALGIGGWLLRGREIATEAAQPPSTSVIAHDSAVATNASAAASHPSPSTSLTSREVVAETTQSASDAGPPAVLEHPLTDALCRDGMVLVDGVRCPGAEQRCIEETSGGCVRYETRCKNERVPLRFCIDRYEYPNERGVRPALMIAFEQAERACRIEHKRLCTDDEWTFACEGADANPFPYGTERREDACNTGPVEHPPAVEAFWNPQKVSSLVARYDRRIASGEQPRCVSAFGVHDLVGNVTEWVTGAAEASSYSAPGASGGAARLGFLKGGDFMNAIAPCRSTRAIRARFYRSFPVGFRCCANPLVSPSGPRPATDVQTEAGH